MNDCGDATGMDRVEEAILFSEASDEALEAAAQKELRAASPTQMFLTSIYSPGCACA